MKPIIIPTDFTPAADTAAHYGAQLAQIINADILLLHLYVIPITINETPVLILSGEELKKNADAALERRKDELQKTYPQLPIRTESRLGEVVDELTEVCKEVQPFAVVMSTNSYTTTELALFGSNTLSVIRRLAYPVITVQRGASFQPLKTIVLATDLQNVDKTPAVRIIEMVKLFTASLHVVHINNKKEAEETPDRLVKLLQEAAPIYTSIQDNNVRHGLETYIKQVAADLLIILPHEHTWIEKFFFKLHTKDLVNHSPIPVLCIPETAKTQHS
jgi:nucleotide-binding universal stress UspA family protein